MKITWDMLWEWEPCDDYDTDRIIEMVGERESIDFEELVRLDTLNYYEKVWVFCQICDHKNIMLAVYDLIGLVLNQTGVDTETLKLYSLIKKYAYFPHVREEMERQKGKVRVICPDSYLVYRGANRFPDSALESVCDRLVYHYGIDEEYIVDILIKYQKIWEEDHGMG